MLQLASSAISTRFLANIRKVEICLLIDCGNYINTMNSTYAAKLSFQIQRINDAAKNINSSSWKIYIIIIAAF